MYQRITTKNGVDAVQQYRSTVSIQSGVDGLALTTNDQEAFYKEVYIPNRLRQWLLDLRLLRHVPIAYFVPDAALLPPESIRFLNIDATWMDRVLDGVFSAANTGTVDMVFSTGVLALVRQTIDTDLKDLAGVGWDASKPLTGMLIRSELVRRWPDMAVTAYTASPDDTDPTSPEQQVAVLRAEPISKDIYIAIFAGSPQMIHVREPNVGVRFGVEEFPVGTSNWKTNHRNSDGTPAAGAPLTVTPKDPAHRVLSIASLGSQVGNTSRMVALQLERRPYVQEFKNSVDEAAGFQSLQSFMNPDGTFNGPKLRGGHTANLPALQQRLAQQANAVPASPSPANPSLKEKH